MSTTDITIFVCGPNKTCDHDYSGWEDFSDPDGSTGGTAVCAKCGARAIDESLMSE